MLVWPIIIIAGLIAQRLKWSHFATMLVLSILGNAYYTTNAVESAARLGEDESGRWHPLVFAADVLLTLLLWSAVFVAAHLVGRWYRARQRKKTE